MNKSIRCCSLVSALLVALVGCGSNTDNSSTSSSGSTSSTTSTSSSSSNSTTSSSSGSSSSGGNSLFPSDVTRPRIMIIGDSISAGPGCYKKYLFDNLQDAGITQYEFVGEYGDDCGGNVRHSAVSCSTTSDFTKSSFSMSNCFEGQSFPGVSQLMPSHNPDLVLLQLGVNDIWGGSTPIQNVLNNYTTLVQQMRNHNPNVVVVTAQIHKVITDSCRNQAGYQNAQELVNAVPGWAASLSTDASPVLVADLWTNSDPYDAQDCVHPDDAGAQKMGANWFDALKDILW